MKILYICPWPLDFDNFKLTESPKTEFGFYTMKRLGVDITCYSPNKNNFIINKLYHVNPLFFGAIITQLGCLKRVKQYDLIYVGFDMHLMPLAIIKALKLCNKPIFVLSHFTYNSTYTKNILKKIFKKLERYLVFKYIDRLSFASEQLLKIASEGGKVYNRQKFVANWGASLDFYDLNIYKMKPASDFFMAAGGMNRDYLTLIKAFERIPRQKLKIFAKYKNYSKGINVPVNVSFINLMKDNSYSDAYKLLRDNYYNCIAVLLPIDYINDVPNGATVLVEAMAMGKPIIITAANTNYIDVEKEGVGLTVKSHDVEGWINAILYLSSHPDEAKKMGERSYQLALKKYNDSNFVNTIYMQMKDLMKL